MKKSTVTDLSKLIALYTDTGHGEASCLADFFEGLRTDVDLGLTEEPDAQTLVAILCEFADWARTGANMLVKQ